MQVSQFIIRSKRIFLWIFDYIICDLYIGILAFCMEVGYSDFLIGSDSSHVVTDSVLVEYSLFWIGFVVPRKYEILNISKQWLMYIMGRGSPRGFCQSVRPIVLSVVS